MILVQGSPAPEVRQGLTNMRLPNHAASRKNGVDEQPAVQRLIAEANRGL
jgi:hypothetical protein